MKALQADTEIAEVQVTCKTTLSYQSHLTKHDTLSKAYKEIEEQNLKLKKELFEQGNEYKKL
mgnify:FL=1